MNLNWKLILLVVLFTLVLAVIFETFLPKTLFNVTAIVGGVTAGYLVDGNYTDGMANGGISVGISGIIYYLIIGSIIGSVVTTAMGDLTALFLLSSLVFYSIYGVLGGLLGFAVRERRLIIQIMS